MRHAQRRVQNYDVVTNMATHSILFMHHLYVRSLICVKPLILIECDNEQQELITLTLDIVYDDLWLQNRWNRRVCDQDGRFNTVFQVQLSRVFILTLQSGYTL